MPTSVTMSGSLPNSREPHPIPLATLGYFDAYAQDQAYDAVMRVFLKLADEGVITRAFMAKRLKKGPEQVTRWLGGPGNWTLKTLADLLLTMDHVPQITAVPLSSLRRGNYAHPATFLFDPPQARKKPERHPTPTAGASNPTIMIPLQ